MHVRSGHGPRRGAAGRLAGALVLLVALLVVLAGCAAADPAPDDGVPAAGTQVGPADPDDIDPARLAPLLGLPPCEDPPTGPDGLDAGALPLPEASVLTTASTDGPLATAQGYSERTPVEIMVAFMRLEGWTVLSAEDEVFEAEIVVEKDGLRVFAKSQAVCQRGSAFVLFGSDDPALVPAPAGAGS